MLLPLTGLPLRATSSLGPFGFDAFVMSEAGAAATPDAAFAVLAPTGGTSARRGPSRRSARGAPASRRGRSLGRGPAARFGRAGRTRRLARRRRGACRPLRAVGGTVLARGHTLEGARLAARRQRRQRVGAVAGREPFADVVDDVERRRS